MASPFSQWYEKALTPISATRALINATRTSVAHVKVEQVLAGCHLYAPFDLREPMSVDFLAFIRGKPEIRPEHGHDHPCMRIYQGAKIYAVYDSGIPLDEFDEYSCPSYAFKAYPRNKHADDWIYTIQDIDYLKNEDAGIKLAAITRLYAEMALDSARRKGLEFLVNRSMRNLSLIPSNMLTVTHTVSGKKAKKMKFIFSFWERGKEVLSTAEAFHAPSFRKEFFSDAAQ